MISNSTAHYNILAGIAAVFIGGSAYAKAVRCADVPDCAVRFADAQRLAKAGATEDALEKFQSIHNEFGDERTIYPIAVLLQRLGRPAEAAEMFRRYLDSGTETDVTKLALVRERLNLAQGEADAVQRSASALNTTTLSTSPKVTLSPVLSMTSESAVTEKSSHPPLYKRWWLWTTVGAVAVGAAVSIGTAISLYARPPDWPDALETRPFSLH